MDQPSPAVATSSLFFTWGSQKILGRHLLKCSQIFWHLWWLSGHHATRTHNLDDFGIENGHNPPRQRTEPPVQISPPGESAGSVKDVVSGGYKKSKVMLKLPKNVCRWQQTITKFFMVDLESVNTWLDSQYDWKTDLPLQTTPDETSCKTRNTLVTKVDSS